jgi:hypothetical protein
MFKTFKDIAHELHTFYTSQTAYNGLLIQQCVLKD